MRSQLALIGLGLALTGACTGDDGGDDEQTVNCATETRDDEFVVGLEKVGDAQALDFKLMTADPAPPARNDNTWVVQINAMSGGVVGAPATDATMMVSPYMPDHGHVSPKAVTVEPQPEAGQYKLTPIYFGMPGLWEVTIDATSSTGNDKVVFRFCIPA